MSDATNEPITSRRMSRRQLFGMVKLPNPKVDEIKQDKTGFVGTVTYPWGTVASAEVTVGKKFGVSNSAGRYEIVGLAPGVYTLVAKPPFPGYVATPLTVEIAARETKVVDIFLDYEKTVVEGHVYDDAGKPIANAALSGVLCGKDIETRTTDDQGYFKFVTVTPGYRFMRVNVRGYVSEARDFVAKKDGTTVVDFHLSLGPCQLHGTVADQKGNPLGAEVALSEAGIIIERTRSNPETGYYEFSLLPGIYDLLTTASEYQSEGWHGEVSGETELNMTLKPSSWKDFHADASAQSLRERALRQNPVTYRT